MSAYTLALLLCTACSLTVQTAHAATTSGSNIYEFDLTLTWGTSMTYTDSDGKIWDVLLDDGEIYYAPNGTNVSLSNEHVNTLDGARNKHIAINGGFPGPTIEVPLGAMVYIHVHNQLMTDSATIHWHGINMKGSNQNGSDATQWSDGVPYVTQCPILPGATFSYKFLANEAGTFWYHSHQAMQKMDGLFGGLVVIDETRPSYPSFTIVVNDWLHLGATSYTSTFVGPAATEPNYSPIPEGYSCAEPLGVCSDSTLINGKGRFLNNTAPLEVHRVEEGVTYLFRFIDAGFDDEFAVSIDNHQLTVVRVDGCEVEPVTVDIVFLSPGERIDVLVNATESPGNYWVRYRAADYEQSTRGFSIFSYTNSSADPTTSPKHCTASEPCVAVNCPFHNFRGWNCIPIHELNSTSYHEAEIARLRNGSDIVERFYGYTSLFNHSINGRALVLPSSNFLQDNYTESGIPCPEKECNEIGCHCTHVDKLPMNRVIQLVIMHHLLLPAIHTFHLHGFRFAVLKVVYPLKDPVTGLISSRYKTDFNCSNRYCFDAYWMDEELGKFEVGNPPLKDNLLIPIGGYAVVRFYTDNPGYWLAHCHQVSHLYSGMAMVFDVDGATARSTVPSNFPTCGDFLLTPSS